MDDGAKDFAAGVAAGVALVATGHPFDTVKVKLQAQQGSGIRYRGAMHCTADILRSEGLKGLYKGASSSLIGVAVESSLLFGTYSSIKRALQGPEQTGAPSVGSTVVAAGVAGAAVSLVLCPTELIKCRLQVQDGPGPNRGPGVPSPSCSGAATPLSSRAPYVPPFNGPEARPAFVEPSPSPAAAAAASASTQTTRGGVLGFSGAAAREQLRLGSSGVPSMHPEMSVASLTAREQLRVGSSGVPSMHPEMSVVSLASSPSPALHRPSVNSALSNVSLPSLARDLARPQASELCALGSQAGVQHSTASLASAVGGRAGFSTGAQGPAHVPVRYAGPWDCAVKTVQHEGPQGLFKGLTATAARESLGNICFFLTYEITKSRVTAALAPWAQGKPLLGLPGSGALERHQSDRGAEWAREGQGGAGNSGERRGEEQQWVGAEQRLVYREAVVEAVSGVMSGGFAGIAFWCAVLPFDVVKTQIQTGAVVPGLQPSAGLHQHLRHLYRHSGLRGLYAGLGPTLWRAFPANAAAVVAWELTCRLLGVRSPPKD